MRKVLLLMLLLTVGAGITWELHWEPAPAAAPDLPATIPEIPAEEEPVTLLFTGDIMLGRNVQTLSRQYGEDYPFPKIAPDIRK